MVRDPRIQFGCDAYHMSGVVVDREFGNRLNTSSLREQRGTFLRRREDVQRLMRVCLVSLQCCCEPFGACHVGWCCARASVHFGG